MLLGGEWVVIDHTPTLLQFTRMYKMSTITVCLINDAAYYTDIDLDTV